MDAVVRHWALVALEEARRSERLREDIRPERPTLPASLGTAAAGAVTKRLSRSAYEPDAPTSGGVMPTPLPGPTRP
jgi:hypothetical protein